MDEVNKSIRLLIGDLQIAIIMLQVQLAAANAEIASLKEPKKPGPGEA